MKKYFLYELKKHGYTIACLTAIMLIIYAVPILTDDISPNYHLYADQSKLYVISLLGGLLAAIVPAWLLSYKMKRRSVDLYYSLPLSHLKVLTVKYLLGLIALFVPYTISYWLGALFFFARVADKQFYFVYYLPQFFASLPAIYCLYSISAFAFTRANKFIDGIAFVIFWMFIAFFIAYYACQLSRNSPNNVMSNYFLPFSPLDVLTALFQNKLVKADYVHKLMKTTTVNMSIAYTLTGLASVGATAGLFIFEKTHKAENAGQISESLFGYKVMIPLYTAVLLGCCDLSAYANYIIITLIIVGSLLTTVLYRRTIKIGLKQTITLIAAIVLGFVLSAINTAI